ncbi:hypothetical protein E9993_20015 [Labilibacter sediminis]|nr:hypothetical protein E9993_20015 [Labilibacter sediminis]
MVLTARLHIEGHKTEDDGIPLITCDFEFIQDIDHRGLPKSQVKGGVIRMCFNSIDDEEIMWWMMSPHADKNGKIIFAGGDDEKVFKTLEFIDARCVYYRESFTRDLEMNEEITISARELILSGATHTNRWSKYDENV